MGSQEGFLKKEVCCCCCTQKFQETQDFTIAVQQKEKNNKNKVDMKKSYFYTESLLSPLNGACEVSLCKIDAKHLDDSEQEESDYTLSDEDARHQNPDLLSSAVEEVLSLDQLNSFISPRNDENYEHLLLSERKQTDEQGQEMLTDRQAAEKVEKEKSSKTDLLENEDSKVKKGLKKVIQQLQKSIKNSKGNIKKAKPPKNIKKIDTNEQRTAVQTNNFSDTISEKNFIYYKRRGDTQPLFWVPLKFVKKAKLVNPSKVDHKKVSKKELQFVQKFGDCQFEFFLKDEFDYESVARTAKDVKQESLENSPRNRRGSSGSISRDASSNLPSAHESRNRFGSLVETDAPKQEGEMINIFPISSSEQIDQNSPPFPGRSSAPSVIKKKMWFQKKASVILPEKETPKDAKPSELFVAHGHLMRDPISSRRSSQFESCPRKSSLGEFEEKPKISEDQRRQSLLLPPSTSADQAKQRRNSLFFNTIIEDLHSQEKKLNASSFKVEEEKPKKESQMQKSNNHRGKVNEDESS